jgi:hypothetical protein
MNVSEVQTDTDTERNMAETPLNLISCEKKHNEVLTYRSEVKVSLERDGQALWAPGG